MKIWQASRKYPGVVILHDVRVQAFFAYVYRWLLGDQRQYLDYLEHYYGSEARHDGECC